MRYILIALLCLAPLTLSAQSAPRYEAPSKAELERLGPADDLREVRAGTQAPKMGANEALQLDTQVTDSEADDLRTLVGGRHWHWWDDWVYWALLPSIALTILILALILVIVV